jgi:hypothetical protein
VFHHLRLSNAAGRSSAQPSFVRPNPPFVAFRTSGAGRTATIGSGTPRCPLVLAAVYARIGGTSYLLIIAAGLFAPAFFRDRLVVPGDGACTFCWSNAVLPLGDRRRVPSHEERRTAPLASIAVVVPVNARAGMDRELCFAVWVTVKGVNVARWQEKGR